MSALAAVLVLVLVATSFVGGGGDDDRTPRDLRAEIGQKVHVITKTGEADIRVLGVQWTRTDKGESKGLVGVEMTTTRGQVAVDVITCDGPEALGDDRAAGTTPAFPTDPVKEGPTVRGIVDLDRAKAPCDLVFRGANGESMPKTVLTVPLPGADTGEKPMAMRPTVGESALGKDVQVTDRLGTYTVRVVSARWQPHLGRMNLCVDVEIGVQSGENRVFYHGWEFASDTRRNGPNPWISTDACPPPAVGTVGAGQKARGTVVYALDQRENGSIYVTEFGGRVVARFPVAG
ncbi:hypothetical protein [Mariniluteicoccus flavus]